MKTYFQAAAITLIGFALIFLSACLTSCTATLRADKLWYNGNIVRPVHSGQVDSLYYGF